MGLWVMGVLSSEFYGVWGMGVSAPSFLWAPPPPPKCLLNLYLLNLSVFTGNPCKNRRAQRAEKIFWGYFAKISKTTWGGGAMAYGVWGLRTILGFHGYGVMGFPGSQPGMLCGSSNMAARG